MPRKTTLRTKYATLRVEPLQIPDGLSPKAQQGLELLADLARNLKDERLIESTTHFFNIQRSLAMRDRDAQSERAALAWGWKGCDVVSAKSGEIVASFPAGREERWFRPSTLLSLMDEHGEDLAIVPHPQAAQPA